MISTVVSFIILFTYSYQTYVCKSYNLANRSKCKEERRGSLEKVANMSYIIVKIPYIFPKH